MFASGYGEQGKKKIRIDLDTFKKTGIVLVQYLYTGIESGGGAFTI